MVEEVARRNAPGTASGVGLPLDENRRGADARLLGSTEASRTWLDIALGIASANINRTTWKEWMKGNRLQSFEDFVGTAAGTLGNPVLAEGTLFGVW